MSYSMIKTKHAFDLLVKWPEYIKVLLDHFSQPEDDQIWIPSVDIKEKDGMYLIRADLPGVREEDIQVEVNNDQLIIKGNRRKDSSGNDEQSHIVERYYGPFERVVKLPNGINESAIKKEYKDGILLVTIGVSDEEIKKDRAA